MALIKVWGRGQLTIQQPEGQAASHPAALIEADIDYLVTWNTRHFQKKAVRDYVQFPILTPGEFLEEFRRALLEEE